MTDESTNSVLVVEDSRMFARTITSKIRSQLGYACKVAGSFKEARELFQPGGEKFFAAVLDLVLPDAPHGEVVDFILGMNIPAVVLTSDFSDGVREHFVSKDIVDYIVKEGPASLDHLVHILRRLNRNQNTKVLLVDDSGVSRVTIRKLLARHRFMILEAGDGLEAMEQLKTHPDVKIIITDYNMPKMDGFELITEVRKYFPMDQMAIIGISAHGGSVLSAKFLKKGANDFLIKPFSNEEFFWRVNQNLQMLDYIESIRKAAVKDHLTGLYNRHFLFDIGGKLFENARRRSFDLAFAMIDVDHFKAINDQFGHICGDRMLRHVGQMIADCFRSSDVVARYGGDEFCIIAPNLPREAAFGHFESIRKSIAASPIFFDGCEIQATVSIGITSLLMSDLENTLQTADRNLYKAKKAGRNRVVADE